ncbi:NAD-dependent epimerase/dehydratase family protein [bacterium]|nr:NAD-dependent epimerase/dehydratase family protein [bacterium]
MTLTEQPATCLVTGGAGFMGAHVTRDLLSRPELQDARIVVLDDLSGGFRENVPDDPRVCFVQGSVTDETLINQMFDVHSFRFVWHLAAYAAEGLSHFIRRFNYTNNLIGSVNLINASIRHETERFVFTSSIAVYGSAQVPMTEQTVPCPEDPYGVAKYAVELDLKAAHETFGLDYTVFRPHNVYGEFQNIGDRYRNVVGIFMNRIMRGQSLPVFGTGEQRRAFSYVSDVSPQIAAAPFVPASRNEAFNVGANQAVSVNELARTVAAEFGVDPAINYLPPRVEVDLAWADHSKAQRVFDPAPETPLTEGVRRMAEWARAVGPRESRRFSSIEVTRNLPPSWSDVTTQH